MSEKSREAASGKRPIQESTRIMIDGFESIDPTKNWILADTRNDADPGIENPQATEIRVENANVNYFLLKKPATNDANESIRNVVKD